MLAHSGEGDASDAKAFFFSEYRLNHLLFTYPKPTVAIMDGITMGGGVGISLPCEYRVATENTRLAMPETGIGLFPDVGGGWYLSRLPGRVGQFMALTGARLDAAECVYLGIATNYVEQSAIEDLLTQFGVIADFKGGLAKHTLSTLLIDENGRIARRADGTAWEPKDFVAQMRKDQA